jgi:hypothetical protein
MALIVSIPTEITIPHGQIYDYLSKQVVIKINSLLGKNHERYFLNRNGLRAFYTNTYGSEIEEDFSDEKMHVKKCKKMLEALYEIQYIL